MPALQIAKGEPITGGVIVAINMVATKMVMGPGILMQSNIEFIESSEPIEIKADLIVANILSSALSVLAPVLASYCRPGGIIALSGILETQEKKIKVIYQEWFDIIGVTKREGWVCISAVRRNN